MRKTRVQTKQTLSGAITRCHLVALRAAADVHIGGDEHDWYCNIAPSNCAPHRARKHTHAANVHSTTQCAGRRAARARTHTHTIRNNGGATRTAWAARRKAVARGRTRWLYYRFVCVGQTRLYTTLLLLLLHFTTATTTNKITPLITLPTQLLAEISASHVDEDEGPGDERSGLGLVPVTYTPTPTMRKKKGQD